MLPNRDTILFRWKHQSYCYGRVAQSLSSQLTCNNKDSETFQSFGEMPNALANIEASKKKVHL